LDNACYSAVTKVFVFSSAAKNELEYNFAVVLYRCEIWSLILRNEHKLRVTEDSLLRRIFGLRKEEIIGGWRKLHNEELHNLYASSDIIRFVKSRRMSWAGYGIREMHIKFWWEVQE
jgi:hypothetical protein